MRPFAKQLLAMVLASLATFGDDIYGGITTLAVPGGATGYFRVAKLGKQWVFATPLGNAFWMRSIYGSNFNFFPDTTAVAAKYGSAEQWAIQRNLRYHSWGFNTLGEYTSVSGLPVPVYGGSAFTSPQVPFILLLTPAQDIGLSNPSISTRGCTDEGKDVIRGVPVSTYDGYRAPLVDVYDPCFALTSAYEVGYWDGIINGGIADKPWIVGITTDDSDSLFGFKSQGGDNSNTFQPYPHIGFLVATAAPTYGPGLNIQNNVAFTDPELKAKAAWITYLKAKYSNSVSALNTAWGTSSYYTSFDDVPQSISGEIVYRVGSRLLPLYNGLERVNQDGTDNPCAPRGTGSCTHVWMHYTGPCDSSTLMVGSSITITHAPGQYTSTPSDFNGSFTISTVLNSPYPCVATYAQTATAYDQGPSNPAPDVPLVTFTETSTTFSVSLAHAPVAANSVTIHVPGGVTGTDNGSGGITGTGIAAGSTIDYTNGAIVLNTSSAPPSGNITADYTGSGYGAGTGVIDEDGRNTTWTGTLGKCNYYDSTTHAPCSAASSGFLTDIDGFAYEFAKKYATVVHDAIKATDTNHLIFGPASINNYGSRARTPILQGLADGGIDVLQLNYDPIIGPLAGNMVENNQTYDITGKPVFVWYSVTATIDSEFAPSMGAYGSPEFATQALRGAHARDVDIPAFLNAKGTNGDCYVIGIDWWAMLGSATEGGGTNWGLITFKDNSYDGVESHTGTVTCSAPNQAYSCGGESANYGNAIAPITTALASVPTYLTSSSCGSGSGGSVSGGKAIFGGKIQR